MTEATIQHVSISKLSCKSFIDRYFTSGTIGANGSTDSTIVCRNSSGILGCQWYQWYPMTLMANSQTVPLAEPRT